MRNTIYAGIGARKTPPEVLGKMYTAAYFLGSDLEAILRSGGAVGADTSFEQGADDAVCQNVSKDGVFWKEIFLPYKRFNRNESLEFTVCKHARAIAKRYHPKWDVLGNVGRDFMGRNTYQLLGKDLQTPCDFVLCWTPNGKAVGGTGQALRHAKDLGIKILNFGCDSDDDISEYLMGLKESRHS